MTEQITSRKNPLLQHMKKLLSSAAYRKEQGEYAAEGTKLLEEAIRWIPDSLTTVLATEKAMPSDLPPHVRLAEVPEDVLKQLSSMETPQGVLFSCKLPEKKPLYLKEQCLILDRLQDPGNVGTILRTADALDIPVILTPDCADAYSHKVVRASMGAVFRTAPQWAKTEEITAACKENGLPLYITAMSERAVDVRQAELRKAALVIGNEGRGVCEYFQAHADGELIIPMNSRCESLNAAIAAAIVMWQMKQ